MVELRQLVLLVLVSCGSRGVVIHEVNMSGLNSRVAAPKLPSLVPGKVWGREWSVDQMSQEKAAEIAGEAGLTETAKYRSKRLVSHSIKTALGDRRPSSFGMQRQ